LTDAALTHVALCTNLESLSLNVNDITDKGLVQLEGLTKLQTLAVGDTKVTDAGIKELGKALPKTKITQG
jgi:internalin A